MPHFKIMRPVRTRSGVALVDIRGINSDTLILCGTREQVIENAKALGLVGVELVELDQDDRPVRRAGAA